MSEDEQAGAQTGEQAGSGTTQTSEPAGGDATHQRSVLRTTGTVALGVFCCIALLASVIGVWARKTVFDTDYWVEQVTPLATNEAILDPLSKYLTDQIMNATDIQQRLQNRLPSELDRLAAPIAAGARTYVQQLVDQVLHSEQFQKAWVEINRRAHAAIVRVIEGTGEVVDTSQPGTVTLNLLPVINFILQKIEQGASSLLDREVDFPEVQSGELPEKTRERLSNLLGREVPADFGQIVVYQDGRLGAAQTALLAMQKLVTLLIILTVALGVGTILVARRRARATIALGLGVVLTLAISKQAVEAIQRQVLELIIKPDARQAANAVLQQMVAGFNNIATLMIVAGLLLLAIGVIVSDLRIARSVRAGTSRLASPGRVMTVVGPHQELFALGGIALAILILVITPGNSLGGLGLLLLVLLTYEVLVFALAARWKSLQEGPDTSTAGGTGAGISSASTAAVEGSS